MKKRILYILAALITISNIVFLFGPLYWWLSTGDKTVWLLRSGGDQFLAWFVGVVISIFCWAPADIARE